MNPVKLRAWAADIMNECHGMVSCGVRQDDENRTRGECETLTAM